MRSAIITTAGQEEQQNQTITINIKYIQHLSHFLKKSKKRQIKLKLNKIACTSLEKNGTTP